MSLHHIICWAAAVAAAAAGATGGSCSAGAGQCEASPKPAAALQGAFSLSQRGRTVERVASAALALEEDDLPDELGAAKAAPTAAGARSKSSATAGISLGQTGVALGRVALEEEEEDPEIVSLSQMGRPMVKAFAGSPLKEGLKLKELSDEALMSVDDEAEPEEEMEPAAAGVSKATAMADQAPAGGVAVLAAEASPDGQQPQMWAALRALATLALATGVYAVLRARTQRTIPGKASEEIRDPLDESEPPLTADECMRYCRGRQAQPARGKAATDAWGCTPLHVAAGTGDAAEVLRLLEGGADASEAEAWDETALHVAARGGHADVCEALLAAGAGVNPANASGRTPLVEAAAAGREAVCRLLIERGGHAGGILDGELPPLLSTLFLSDLVQGLPKADSAAAAAAARGSESEVEEEAHDEAFESEH